MATRREFIAVFAASVISTISDPRASFAQESAPQHEQAGPGNIFIQPDTRKDLPTLPERIWYLARRNALKRSRRGGSNQTLFDISGMHNGPYSGGVGDIDRFLDDIGKFGFGLTGHKTLNPTRELIAASASRGIPMVARIQTEDGLFREDQFEELVVSLLKHYKNTDLPVAIQVGNEPNLGNADTGENFYEPAEYAEKAVIPAIDFIYRRSGGRIKSITPPVAPNPTDPEAYLYGYPYMGYLYGMLSKVAEVFPANFIRQKVLLGANYYIYKPGQKPWEEIRKLAIGIGFDAFKTFIPTIGLEAGMNQESTPGRYFTHDEAAITTETLLKETLPPDIDEVLSKFFWWIYNGGEIYDFTLCEWVNPAGEYNPEALAAIKIAGANSPRPSGI